MPYSLVVTMATDISSLKWLPSGSARLALRFTATIIAVPQGSCIKYRNDSLNCCDVAGCNVTENEPSLAAYFHLEALLIFTVRLLGSNLEVGGVVVVEDGDPPFSVTSWFVGLEDAVPHKCVHI